MRVYLDNCCYNRPYDDQTQVRIALETRAKLCIQERILEGKIELISSYVLNAENSMNPVGSKREAIKRFMDENTGVYVGIAHEREVERRAEALMRRGVKFMDACHVACALLGGCDYFLSTDDRLLRCRVEGLKLLNPVDFLREMEAVS